MNLRDSSGMAVKKMIAGYLIRKARVYSGCRFHIGFSINFAQLELGLDIPNEYYARIRHKQKKPCPWPDRLIQRFHLTTGRDTTTI